MTSEPRVWTLALTISKSNSVNARVIRYRIPVSSRQLISKTVANSEVSLSTVRRDCTGRAVACVLRSKRERSPNRAATANWPAKAFLVCSAISSHLIS